MNLEDHAGDVIRKARMMSKVEPSAVAKAAGLTEAELSTLEDSGKSSKKPNFAALAGLIGLNTKKLENFYNGWQPAETNLSVWPSFRWLTTSEEGTTVHAYLIWDEVSKEAALFDTGWNSDEAFKLIAANKLQLKHLFITHTHPDHIAAVAAVKEKFPNVRVHTDAKSAPAQDKNRRDETISVGSLRVTNRDTPGHAEDGVTFIVSNWPNGAPAMAIVGDAIFAGSMGGAPQHGLLAKQKVREQILSLPDNTLICPGHGPLTTVGEQKANNAFF
jgi:glyoxylase-like metal-dependent hydrolase (beta-lactamase superfamily II)